jgi:AcrR family transcriptional regulator
MARKKTPLTSNDYITAAVTFVSERGLSSMTMRALGDEMGVDATALYRHFPNKESLIDAMIDWMIGQALVLAEQSNKHDPRDRIMTLATSMRATFEKYPDIGLALIHSEGASLNGLTFSQLGIQSLRELGLSGEDLVVAYQSFESYVMGSCVHDFSGAPHNMDIRRARYRAIEEPEFDEQSRSSTEVRLITQKAFELGFNAILDEITRR